MIDALLPPIALLPIAILPIAMALSSGLLLAFGLPRVLRWLPEPMTVDPEKIPYRSLARRSFVLPIAVFGTVAAGIAGLRLAPQVQPLWWVLATFGVALAGIDALTMWLPLRLTQASWLAMTVAGVVSVLAGLPLHSLIRGLIAATISGAGYGLIWLISRGGFGFGDVRFAPLLGMATGTISWTLLIWTLLLGSLAGAAHGIIKRLLGRQGPFPYAPAMLGGGFLAVLAPLVIQPTL